MGLSGKMQTGKTYVARQLEETYDCVVRLSFATALKEDIVKMGFSYIDVYHEKPTHIRALLQAYGQARRGQDKMYWISRMAQAISGLDPDTIVVIDDVRFPNEADWIRGQGGLLIRLERPDMKREGSIYLDDSECALDDYPLFHNTVYADGGAVEYLYRQVERNIVTWDGQGLEYL